MDVKDLRIALFSGNYNYVRDGANKAQNRLVGSLLDMGAAVRVYSPTIPHPPFAPTGDLVSVPSMAVPLRPEYRIPVSLSGRVRRDLAAFAPNIVHISSPDRVARQAAQWARDRGLPVIASVHTRFETYPRYYGLRFAEPLVEAWLRKLYRRCDALVAPSPSMVDILLDQKMNRDVSIWSRGVERAIFHPSRRDLGWRRALGIGDDEFAVGFLGRLVLEKGLNVVVETLALLRERGVPHRVIVVGDGPARAQFEGQLPQAAFVGFQEGPDLGRAVASMDALFNPSVTETFGNVTLEAMACALPVVAAHAAGSDGLVKDHVTGRLVRPGDRPGFADALAAYAADADLRRAHGAAAERAAATYDWEAINRRMADTYIRLVEARLG